MILESDDRADPVCIEVLMSSLLAPGLGGWGAHVCIYEVSWLRGLPRSHGILAVQCISSPKPDCSWQIDFKVLTPI